MKTNVEQWWNHIDRGKLKYSETDHHAIVVATNLTRYDKHVKTEIEVNYR